MRYTIEQDGELLPVEVRPLGSGRYRVQIGDEDPIVVKAATEGDLTHILHGDRSHAVVQGKNGPTTYLHTGGHHSEVQVLDSAAARRRARSQSGIAGNEGIVRSPMPGRVVKVLVEQGDAVTVGQGVVIVEAMKMENELRSESAGYVEAIHVQPDDRVEGNAKLVTISEPAAP